MTLLSYSTINYHAFVSRLSRYIAFKNYSGITTATKASLNTLTDLTNLSQSCKIPVNDTISHSQTNWLTNLYYQNQKTLDKKLIAPNIHLSTLSNGLNVVVDESSTHFASIGILLSSAGSSNEQIDEIGSTYIMEKLAFRGTKKWSQSQLVDKIQSLGCSIECSPSRDGLLYSVSILSEKVPELLELLYEMIFEPVNATDQHISECIEKLEFELVQMKEKPDVLLPELVHMKMFGGQGLGNSLFNLLDPHSSHKPSLSSFQRFRNRCIQPESICIGAIGVPNDRFIQLVEKHFSSIPSNTFKTISNSYHLCSGGPLYVQDQSFLHTIGLEEANPYPNHINFMLAFPVCPSWHIQDIFPSAVGMSLLGGGSSFSSGGPGKGLYSRLYTRLLNQYGFIENAHAMMVNYSNAGIFSVIGSCKTYSIENVLNLIIRELFDIASFAGNDHYKYTRGLSILEKTRFDGQVELNRAKNQIKSNLLMGLEPLSSRLENSVKNVVLMGNVISRDALLEKMDQVNVNDLARIRNRMLGLEHLDQMYFKPLPTIVAVGSDLSCIPSYSTILGMIEEHSMRMIKTR